MAEGLATDSLIYFEKGIDIWSVLYFNKWYISMLYQVVRESLEATEHFIMFYLFSVLGHSNSFRCFPALICTVTRTRKP